MDPSHIPLWRCVSSFVPLKTPRNIFHLLSQIKFNGEGETYAFEHIFQFRKICFSQNISHEGVICRLFTLTFAGQVKNWYETLSTASIHTWG
jgi:hypothetical protein